MSNNTDNNINNNINQEFEKFKNDVLTNYTPENRLGMCELILVKYRFENYKLSDTGIMEKDLIVKDPEVRNMCTICINNGACSYEELSAILNKLTWEQAEYIGY